MAARISPVEEDTFGFYAPARVNELIDVRLVAKRTRNGIKRQQQRNRMRIKKAKFQLPSCRFSSSVFFFGAGARTQAQLTHAHKLHFYADILLFAMAGFSFLEANALKN